MKIGTVIVTFNRKQLLLKTLESLRNQSLISDYIIIIDNYSSDHTLEYLVEKDIIDVPKENNGCLESNKNNIYYYNLLENKGGAGGFYAGIKKAIELECDWIWLMDDDICPRADTLEQYISFIKENNKKNIGAVMGLRYYSNIPFSFETYEHNFRDWKVSIKDKLLNIELVDKFSTLADFPFEGPIINGKIVQEIGLPNKDFFIIGDDTDYSIRINQKANSYFLPSAKFDRLISPFNDKPKKFDWKQYYLLRNMIYINKKYAENFKVRQLRPLLMMFLELKKFIKLAFIEKDLIYLKDINKIPIAFIDGYFGKLGKKYVPGDF